MLCPRFVGVRPQQMLSGSTVAHCGLRYPEQVSCVSIVCLVLGTLVAPEFKCSILQAHLPVGLKDGQGRQPACRGLLLAAAVTPSIHWLHREGPLSMRDSRWQIALSPVLLGNNGSCRLHQASAQVKLKALIPVLKSVTFGSSSKCESLYDSYEDAGLVVGAGTTTSTWECTRQLHILSKHPSHCPHKMTNASIAVQKSM